MRGRISIVSGLLLLLVIQASGASADKDTIRILFIGNSYTFFNDMPVMVRKLAEDDGQKVEFDMIAPGGWTLKRHLGNDTLIRTIKKGGWDYIVVQEQSRAPALDSVEFDVYPAARAIDSLRAICNPAARLIFYMTWGRKDGDKTACPTFPELCTYKGMQKRLTDSYLEMTYRNNAWCAPVGIAWQRIRNGRGDIELYDSDGSHPSLHGSYLAANVIYAVIAQKTYRSAYLAGIDAPEALYIQQTAQETVLANLPLWNIRPPQQPESVTARFFSPDSSKPYLSSVIKKTDSRMIASYSDVMSHLRRETDAHPGRARLESLGVSPCGKDIPVVYIGTGKDASKGKLWLQAGLHGNEPAGTEALCLLLHYLLNDHEAARLLKYLDMAIVPIANVDGYSTQSRVSSSGLDLNRDQTKLADGVSLLLKKAFHEWSPEVALDIHEYTPSRKEYATLRDVPAGLFYDALFLPTGYPNVAPAIREMSRELFQQRAEQALAEQGFSSGFYFTPVMVDGKMYLAKDAKSPQSSSTSFALSNAVSMLVEIRGIGLGTLAYGRRINTAFTVALSYLETACRFLPEVKKTIRSAVRQTLERRNGIVVKFETPVRDYPVKFIDYNSADTFTVTLPAYDARFSKPVLVRPRPSAYILDKACKREVENLRASGIDVDELLQPASLDVSRYRVIHYEKSASAWENIYPVTVKTSLEKCRKTFPAGTYKVSLKQKNANLAVSLLEPESENGFVSFNVTAAGLNKILPVYRIE
ncbi:MAG: succinylglutamate desuccinylase/aspartoacylase family protein [Tannerella sp.]|jgi:hypothetical protein|nr:succinylglutamate desuccinylase/aspartoacylase family protein [Tannerella sp.]